MANAATSRDRGVAQVDFLVDENGSRIDVPDDTALKVATDVEQTVGATGPTNWWRLGLIALAVIALGLLLMQTGRWRTAHYRRRPRYTGDRADQPADRHHELTKEKGPDRSGPFAFLALEISPARSARAGSRRGGSARGRSRCRSRRSDLPRRGLR